MVKVKSIVLLCLFVVSAFRLNSQVILDSVIVKASKERVNTTIYTPGNPTLKISITGESDPLKMITSQPGVSTGIEGTSSIFVRGGNNGNNRTELDGVPFYDSGHLLGLISSFPAGIIKNITFRKGGQSSVKGDFSASLTKICTKDSPDGTSVTLSPFFAGIYKSGYIRKKNDISYITSARYTLINPLWKIARQIGSIDNINFNPVSGDLFIKLNIPLSNASKVTAGAYYSHDDISFAESNIDMSINWGNKTTYASWSYSPSHWLTIESSGYYLKYTSSQNQQSIRQEQLNTKLYLDGSIEEYALNTNANMHYKDFNLSVGAEMKNRNLYCSSPVFRSNTKNFINSIFADIKYSNSFFSTGAGIRQTGYSFDLTDLHLNTTIFIGKYFGAEVTYDKMHQLTHTAEGGLAGWRDFIIPAYDSLQQETCSQIYLGGFYSRKRVTLSIGAYYKEMENLTSLKRTSDLFFGSFMGWNQILETGTGISKGIEASVVIYMDKFSGTTSYTLSKTDRKFDNINEGKRFPFQYDRRHILNFIGSYTMKEREEHRQMANLNISYSSGGYSTLPVARYQAAELPFIGQLINDGSLTDLTLLHLQSILAVPDINGFQMPYYLRIDLGYVFNWKRQKRETELSLGVTNILNRHNASLVYYRDGYWRQMSIIPIMPSVGFKISF